MIFRGKIISVLSTILKRMRANISGLTSETIDNIPIIQQYGFQSNPPINSEVVVSREGEAITIIATDNTKYRVSLASGEVRIYCKSNSFIDVKDREISMESTSIRFNSNGLDPTEGIVTGKCLCAFTGLVHPDVSSNVFASK